MDDTVSRQAVKDWLSRWEGYIDKDTIARMQCRVIDIPSAQPDVPDTNVGDIISRQDAIGALMEILDRPNHAEFLYTDEICKALEQLPSAQPFTEEEIQAMQDIEQAQLDKAYQIGVESAQPKRTENTREMHACDCISRRDAIDEIRKCRFVVDAVEKIIGLPPAQPERLTDDDLETIRIHLNAYKESLGNQQRWKEAEEYQRLIDRFMSFASSQMTVLEAYYKGKCDGAKECTAKLKKVNDGFKNG